VLLLDPLSQKGLELLFHRGIVSSPCKDP